MSEERQGVLARFWNRIFSSRSSTAREERVIEYIIHRMNEGAHLRDIVGEEYVRRNLSQSQIERVLQDPRIVEAAREHMQEEFLSGRLDPGKR
ncbi:hypothetical protein E0L93_02085 [Rubrobacter taiwanensis]|uniref:Uncharacterized protein n=1 Tax=Rubrobacter taiwanensis TaxID=185139 RepID=A0A4R1BR08_9ACTN|nr:hypothetical protein [Rubrobacter taiwanensis]TCJ20199.1 hypothetical protein E0L93_02085 [Rubrobacter taiwanensis]